MTLAIETHDLVKRYGKDGHSKTIVAECLFTERPIGCETRPGLPVEGNPAKCLERDVQMNIKLIAKQSITISAPASKVWEALINPELIKQYLFGSEVVTDWKVGSSVIYKGTYEGKTFEDKGKVVKLDPEKLMVLTHWSPLSGSADSPENYHTVRYELVAEEGGTQLTISQDNNPSEDEQKQNEQFWGTVLQGIKKLVE